MTKIDLRKHGHRKTDLPYDPRSTATILRYILLLYLRRITTLGQPDPGAFWLVQPLSVKLRQKAEAAYRAQERLPLAMINQYALYFLHEIEAALEATPAQPDQQQEVARITALTHRLTQIPNGTLTKRARRIEVA